MWYLLLAVPVGAVAVFVWLYRRTNEKRSAATEKRMRDIFGAGIGLPAESVDAPLPGSATSATSAASATPAVRSAVRDPGTASPANPPRYVRRGRVLDAAETLWYYALKTGLRDYEVLPRVSLAAVVDLDGGRGGESETHRRAQQILDFVVCDKAMQPLVALDLAKSYENAGPELRRFRQSCLEQSGVRQVVLPAGAVPRPDDVRGLVLGGAQPQESPDKLNTRGKPS
jgi:hypothetical protein